MRRARLHLAPIVLLACGCGAAASEPHTAAAAPPRPVDGAEVAPAAAAPQGAAQGAFKGHEIYSWQEPSGEWRFAMVYGTNRIKTAAEISAAAIDEAELRRRLGTLAPLEHVGWCPHEELRAELPLALPPEDRVARLVAEAQARGVRLEPCPHGAP